MERQQQQLCRRFVVLRLQLLLFTFCCVDISSRRSFLVDSFVLRGGPSIKQLAEAIEHDDNDNNMLQDDDEEIEDDDTDFVRRLLPLDVQRLTDEANYRTPNGYENDFDDNLTADDASVDEDEDDNPELTLAEHMLEATANEDAKIDDSNDDDVVEDDENAEKQHSSEDLLTLNKSELHQLFDLAKPDDSLTVEEMATKLSSGSLNEGKTSGVVKKSELTKTEVEQMFDKPAEMVVAKQSETVSLAPVVVVAAGNSSSSVNGDSSEFVVVPTIKVTTIEELVKNVAEDRNGGVKGKDVTLDIKEEKLLPGTNAKATNEWMIELTEPDDDESTAMARGWMMRNGGSKGSKKFKRSPPVDDGALSDVLESASEKMAKSRAVELLKAYIQLQEDENRHLTEALNMATRGQTERSDSYIGGEIEHLRQAVRNEKALERIRDFIRVAEDAGDVDEEQNAEDDSVDDFQNDNDDDIDLNNYSVSNDVLTFGMKRGSINDDDDDDGDEEILEPSVFSFDDVDDKDSGDEEQLREDEENDEEAVLKDQLRKFIIQTELNDILQAAAAARVEDEEGRADEEWMPEDEMPKSFRISDRESLRLNPFTRDIEDLYRNRGLALNKRSYPTALQYEEQYEPSDFDELSQEEEDDDEQPEANEEVADLAVLDKILQMNPARDVQSEFVEQLTETELCPAVQELTDNCLVARERGLVLDDEALQLCNRHQLCYSCGFEFGLTPETCDRDYLTEVDLLCGRDRESGHSQSRCKTEATGLYVIMLDGHRYHAADSPGFSSPPACRRRCTYDFIAGSTARRPVELRR